MAADGAYVQRHALPIAALVLLLLLAWLWLLEREPPAGPADRPPDAAPLWADFEPATVQALSIRDKGDRGIRLERSGDRWLVAFPDDTGPRRANDDLANAATSALAALESDRALSDADPASDYGLGEEALEVVVELGGGEARTLRIGDPLTVAHGHYARVDDATVVHVIPSGPLLALTRDPLSYRDRRVLPLDPDQILTITSELTDPPLHLERSGRTWVLEPQPGGRAEENTVASLLDALTSLGGRSWAPAVAEPEGPRLLLGTRDGEVSVQLVVPLPAVLPTTLDVRVRGPLPEPRDDDLVATVPTDALAALWTEPVAWRSSELVELNPWLVTTFSWSAGGTLWTFDEEGDRWLGPEEQGSRPPVARDRVRLFLQQVDGLRGIRWLAEEDAPSGLVETAELSGEHADGSRFGLTLLRGPSRDYARADDESGLREIDGTANDLLGALHALPEAP